ncbi:MAG: tetratricopeptide (TPR) repeat protein [Cognaticolwellia sp.]|jgi:tetratricopeptide (TPR) repeat protein
MLLLLATLAQAEPSLECAALDPLTGPLCEQAIGHAEAQRWNKAAAAWKIVRERDPSFDRATLGLARARAQQGMTAEAESLYRSLGLQPNAVQELALLIEDSRPSEAMGLYKQLQTLELGEALPFLQEARAALKAEELARSQRSLDRFLELEGFQLAPEESLALMLAIAGVLRQDPEQREEARAWLQRVEEIDPEGVSGLQARERLDRMAVEDSASQLAVGGGEALLPQQRAQLEEIRSDLAAGRLSRSEREIRALLEEAPRSPEAWATAGDLARAQGDSPGAETAWLTAIALDPEEATWRVRYGRLLAEDYAGRRHGEASEELERALTLRPGWTGLYVEVAELRIALGDFEGAVQASRDYLRVDPGGEQATTAQELLRDLEREKPDPPALESLLAKPPTGIPTEAWEAFKRAKVYLEDRDDDVTARIEAEHALVLAPDYVDALNLLAHLQLREPDLDGALESYQRSLQVRPDQPQIVLAVGYSLQDLGRDKDAGHRFEQAASLGAEDALYALAQLAADRGDWREARQLLNDYFAQASGGQNYTKATALAETLERRHRLELSGIAGGAALALGLPMAWLLRRQSGSTLAQLLARHPEAYRDVASILSAIRHEVLKHNTTVLPAAADALEAGQDQPVIEAFDHLLGRGKEGVCPRYWGYVTELQALARRYGVRLNLERRDPLFSKMNQAFLGLEKVGACLGPVEIEGDRDRHAQTLRALSSALNHDSYLALGRLIREVCVLPISRDFLGECWQQVAKEPAFAGQSLPMPEIHLGEPGIPVRAFKREMSDLLVNLLRNATQVALEERGDQACLGLFVDEEFDEITGLERVVFAVADNALSKLSDDMIRGRYIARGLGIVVELVRRNGGQIRVEQWPGYEKAIVVRLPRAEFAESASAESASAESASAESASAESASAESASAESASAESASAESASAESASAESALTNTVTHSVVEEDP